MKFFTNIISTTFSEKIETDKDVLEIAEFVFQTFAFKIKKRSVDKLIMIPFGLSFFIPHPNAFIINSKFIYNKKNETVQLKVLHPLHILLNLFLLFTIAFEKSSFMLFIFPIILCYLLTYTIINQRTILKKIIKEL